MTVITPEQKVYSQRGEPVWQIAVLFPTQGNWSETDYLALESNHLVEFSNGTVEILPMPTRFHQDIVAYLYEAFLLFVRPNQLGRLWFAPLPLRLWERKFREPDIMFLATENLDKAQGAYPHGADLVVEVVSGSQKDRDRDLIEKRIEYAQAGISEYWIVDPETQTITVLRLDGRQYLVHGEFGTGNEATSWLLAGFQVSVDAVFAAANQ
ncbi:MAG: Uma2 family endonuclease [Ardenticatenaceae bacterium]|nr:Uma2 family endonuclease [Ardenticatenaceae bacterium]